MVFLIHLTIVGLARSFVGGSAFSFSGQPGCFELCESRSRTLMATHPTASDVSTYVVQGLLLMAFPRVTEESARSAALSVCLAEESLMTFSSGRFFGPLLLAKAFTFTRTYNDSPNICWLEFEPARGVSDHASSSVIVLESMLHFIWRSMTARLR
ncbi:hypothetical protein ACFE04_013437 [Oxalis oulophora]